MLYTRHISHCGFWLQLTVIKELTAWSTVVSDKLGVAHLLNKFLTITGIQSFNTVAGA
jgi:hypothetical protein